MKIKIRKPIGYSQIGRKDQQEDAVWPLFSDVSADNPCIVLCDGVGGSEHGEVASQTTSKIIGEYLTRIIKENQTVTDADLQEAVNLAYDELEKIDTEASEDGAVSMATTLTCVCLYNDGILAAHMGDSRIYHVRPGQGLLYQSADHSLVNALLQAGELTIEEAKTFPRKNVITKAIQPHGNKRFKAEVQHLTEVQSGDYLFLCCDGVLEQLTNERLVEVLSMDCSDKEKLALLEAESTDKTKDNYTAYLIPIDKVTGVSSIVQEEDIVTEVVENHNSTSSQTTATSSSLQSPVNPTSSQYLKLTKKKYYIAAVVGAVLMFLMFFLGRCSSKDSNVTESRKSRVEQLKHHGNKKNVPVKEVESLPEEQKEKSDSPKSDEKEPVTSPIDELSD